MTIAWNLLSIFQTHFVEAHFSRSSSGHASPLWRLESLQERALSMVLDLSCEEDREVTRAAVESLIAMVPKLYFPSATASAAAGCVTGREVPSC